LLLQQVAEKVSIWKKSNMKQALSRNIDQVNQWVTNMPGPVSAIPQSTDFFPQPASRMPMGF
jgi:hypothetical protein